MTDTTQETILVGMDAARFSKPKKLASYIGLNPAVVESGKAGRRRALSSHGRRDLKALMVQTAQSVLRHGKTA